MRLTFVHTLLFGVALTSTANAAPEGKDNNDGNALLADLQKQVEATLEAQEKQSGSESARGGKQCTLANAAIRRDWYISSIHTLNENIRN
jgi:hypothetical protein